MSAQRAVPEPLEASRVPSGERGDWPASQQKPTQLSRREKQQLKERWILSFQDAQPLEATTVTAQGWVRGQPGHQQIRIRLTNRSASLIHMNWIVDEYVIRTTDGRMLALPKEEFLQYPTALFPGDEASVFLRAPADVIADTVIQLTATLNADHTSLVLTPTPPSASPLSP